MNSPNTFMKRLFLAAVSLLTFAAQGQDWVQILDDKVILDNASVKRVITFRNDSLIGTTLQLSSDTSFRYIADSPEFAFTADGNWVNGYSGWRWLASEKITGPHQGQGVRITLQHQARPIKVTLHYLLYPDLPLVRKWLTVLNTGQEDINLEYLTVENLQGNISAQDAFVLHNYARMKHLGRFVGNWDDPVVVVHDRSLRRGFALGNEAAGVLKRTAFHTEGHRNNVEIGMTYPGQDFPFRKWIAPGEPFETPKTFICLYAQRDDGFEVVNEEVNRFIVLHMQPRVIQLAHKPTFVYNTWYPFRTFVSDTLVKEVAAAAAACGLQEFIIDDGWQVNFQGVTSERSWGGNYGDWRVDQSKFAGGLKPTFDYIKSLDMKPGLWISIASATQDAKVYQEHPEWFVKNKQGEPGNLHYESGEGGFYSASFGTDWYDYIKNTILRLVKAHGLEYAKLDLAVITSPYVNNDTISGSYATDHPYHKDHRESYYVIYDRLLTLFDELHQEAPDLFIDCTFETAGKLHLMDYAIAQHAEGNWLSNFEEPSPLGPLRVRQMAWWRSPALPAASLVIGNLPLDDPNFEYSLKSLIGTLPIVLGDPRKLSDPERSRIKAWSEWMQRMQQQYDYMSYRKDLAGFGEPQQGAWDGWQRINFQTQQGGIVGVFRHGAQESTRTVFLKDLAPEGRYVVAKAPLGETILTATGQQLMEEGFTVTFPSAYEGNIYEISKQ